MLSAYRSNGYSRLNGYMDMDLENKFETIIFLKIEKLLNTKMKKFHKFSLNGPVGVAYSLANDQ